MRYRALASPAFMARHFAEGPSIDSLARAPAVVYGPDDQLQHLFMAAAGASASFIHHLCPSSEGFVRLLASGLGWGMVPELQVSGELARGELVEVLPGRAVDVPLYWHHWRNGGQLLGALTEHLIRQAPQWLVTTP
jgi:LysR family transcriptional regulator (chromosome initiation inhibitor)